VPELLALVGAGEERTFAREELFDAWRRFLERMAGRYPLVLALVDIHWADAGLLDFIDHLVDWAVGPVMVLTLARPELLETRPSWGGGKRNYSGLYLDPLAPSENEAMLDDLLPAELPVELKREIVERSEGNPLFTEEIVRMLIDRGVLRATSASRWEVAAPVAEIDLPRSIHGLIAARLDTLPADEKATLQDASVVGRIFWSGAVGRLAQGEAPQLREALGRLRVKELIVPREPPAFSGELEFGFRHVLIRDVAYDSLPKAARAAKHAAVARWAEKRSGERREELAELIATHYTEALRFEREVGVAAPSEELARNAFEWARTAGERSLRLWQRQEAVRWFRQALDLAEAASASEETFASLWESYARALTELAPWTEVSHAYEEALARLEALGMPRDAGRVEGELARIAFNSGRDEAVLPWVERALVRLEPFGDSEDLAGVLHVLGWYHFRRGNADLIETPVRRSVEMARRLGAQTIEADGLVTLGSALSYQAGGYAEGTGLLEAGYQLSREAGSMLVTLRAANNLAANTADSEVDLSRLDATLDDAIELARRLGAHALESWLLGNLGYVRTVQGRLDEAESAGERALALAREMDEPPGVALRLLILTRVLVERGDVGRAEPLWAEAVAIARTSPESQTFAFAAHMAGLIALGRGRPDDGVPAMRAALDDYGDFQYASAIATDLIRVLAWMGNEEEARSRLAILAERAPGRSATALRVRWLEAVLDQDRHAAETALTEVVERLRGTDRPIDRARAMIDLALIRERNGHSGAETLEDAQAVLEATGARLYLVEVERARRAMAQLQGAAPSTTGGRAKVSPPSAD
jgi:tetratricopeptide (TPR) repeat protein